METFFPTMQEVHRWSDREKKVDVPLFNCYVFVRCSLGAEDRTQIYRVDSILGVVGSRGVGLPIPDEQIDSVRTLLAQKSPWRAHPFSRPASEFASAAAPWTGWKASLFPKMATTAWSFPWM